LALEADGKHVEAQQEYDKALEIDPAYSPALISRMHALLAMKKPKEAFEMYAKI
jgi:Tfp pilus assembly protein PilF